MNELAEYEKFIEIVVVLARIKRLVLPLSIPESVPKSRFLLLPNIFFSSLPVVVNFSGILADPVYAPNS